MEHEIAVLLGRRKKLRIALVNEHPERPGTEKSRRHDGPGSRPKRRRNGQEKVRSRVLRTDRTQRRPGDQRSARPCFLRADRQEGRQERRRSNARPLRPEFLRANRTKRRPKSQAAHRRRQTCSSGSGRRAREKSQLTLAASSRSPFAAQWLWQ